MPSSPVYLLSQEKEDEARKALQWLRGSSYDIDKEIQQASAFQMHPRLEFQASLINIKEICQYLLDNMQDR